LCRRASGYCGSRGSCAPSQQPGIANQIPVEGSEDDQSRSRHAIRQLLHKVCLRESTKVSKTARLIYQRLPSLFILSPLRARLEHCVVGLGLPPHSLGLTGNRQFARVWSGLSPRADRPIRLAGNIDWQGDRRRPNATLDKETHNGGKCCTKTEFAQRNVLVLL
jgi:hypothetical protein